MKCERRALVMGSAPPSGHSVHKTGDTWRAPAGSLIKTHLDAAVEKTGDKISRSVRWQRIDLSWEKSVGRHGQLLAPQTTDPPDIFEAVNYIHRPCLTRTGLAVG